MPEESVWPDESYLNEESQSEGWVCFQCDQSSYDPYALECEHCETSKESTLEQLKSSFDPAGQWPVYLGTDQSLNLKLKSDSTYKLCYRVFSSNSDDEESCETSAELLVTGKWEKQGIFIKLAIAELTETHSDESALNCMGVRKADFEGKQFVICRLASKRTLFMKPGVSLVCFTR